jgi:hypothetical protein
MLAPVRQGLDIARRGHARAVLVLDSADSIAAQRQHLAVDRQPAVVHLHPVARQADHALDIGLARIARQSEHDDVAVVRQLAEQPLGGLRRDRHRQRVAAVAVGVLRNQQLVADQQARQHRAGGHIIGLGRHGLDHQDHEHDGAELTYAAHELAEVPVFGREQTFEIHVRSPVGT